MIEKIKIGLNNLYLFKNKNDEYLLLDTGINVKNKEILKKLIQKIGDIKKIKVIVLSHSHSDHVGNLKMLVDEIGEKKDMEKLIFIDFLQQEKILLLEYGFGNMKIIETKGHSDDSISIEVFDEKNNEKYLFCGDLVQNLCFKFPLIPLFGENKEELIENWKKIILNGYDKIFPAIGKELVVRDLIRRLEKNEKNRI